MKLQRFVSIVLMLLPGLSYGATWYFLRFNPPSGAKFTELSGQMVVPPIPRAATYYLWPGLQPTDNTGGVPERARREEGRLVVRLRMVLRKSEAGLGRWVQHQPGRDEQLHEYPWRGCIPCGRQPSCVYLMERLRPTPSHWVSLRWRGDWAAIYCFGPLMTDNHKRANPLIKFCLQSSCERLPAGLHSELS